MEKKGHRNVVEALTHRDNLYNYPVGPALTYMEEPDISFFFPIRKTHRECQQVDSTDAATLATCAVIKCSDKGNLREKWLMLCLTVNETSSRRGQHSKSWKHLITLINCHKRSHECMKVRAQLASSLYTIQVPLARECLHPQLR